MGRGLVAVAVAALVVGACGGGAGSDGGPVAHYPLDGDADDVAGAASGIVTGAAAAPDRRGNEGAALRFDGVDDLVRFPHDDALSLTNEFTIAVWVEADPADDPGAFLTLFEKSDPERDGHSRYGLWLLDGRPWACFETADTAEQPCVQADTPIGTGWHHVAAVRSGRRAMIYVDGVQVADAFVGLNDIAQSGFDAFIATDAFQRAPVWLAATLDDLQIYDRGLSPGEVADLAAG